MSNHHHRHSWRKLSQQQRTAKPLCADPFGWHKMTGSYTLATEVHHVISVEQSPDKLLDTENLMNVCATCHKALHSKSDAIQTLLDAGVSGETIAGTISKGIGG